MCIIGIVLCWYAVPAHAVPIGVKVTYQGKGAGEVVFDGSAHAASGLTCSVCHDGQGLVPPMFEMKKNSSFISMRKMQMGLSCGHCHKVSMKDMSSCSLCHHK
jgi:c(7)-type cytochrome triheme protein